MSRGQPKVSWVLGDIAWGAVALGGLSAREGRDLLELRELGLDQQGHVSPSPLPLSLSPVRDLPSQESGCKCSPQGFHSPDQGGPGPREGRGPLEDLPELGLWYEPCPTCPYPLDAA